MRKLFLVVVAIFLLGDFSVGFAQDPIVLPSLAGKGTGYEYDPYVIETINEYINFAADVNAGRDCANTYIELGADIDCTGDLRLRPIGDTSNPFKGHFDGKGYEVINIYLNSELVAGAHSGDYLGFFGKVVGAEIKNVRLSNANIVANNKSKTVAYTGGLVGAVLYEDPYGPNGGSTTISNCYVSGTVEGDNIVGGFVGYIEDASTIKNSYSSCLVLGESTLGGFAGSVAGNSTISSCYAKGVVEATNLAGGFAYKVEDSSIIKDSYSSCVVFGGSPSSFVTSITDSNNSPAEDGMITNCFYDSDFSNVADPRATGLTYTQFRNPASYPWTWASGTEDPFDLTVVNAWIAPNEGEDLTFDGGGEVTNAKGAGRPYLYWQHSKITNGPVQEDGTGKSTNKIEISIEKDASINVVERGVRTRKEGSSDWIFQNDGLTDAGVFDYQIIGLRDGGFYYVQSYFLDQNDVYHLGDMVKTELEPEYYITYNGNNNMGGSTVDDLSPYINGYDVTVLTNSFIRTGYSFLSWNTASDGTGTSYNPSEVISAISADITLYAQWSSVDYTISYNGNGSTGGSTTDSSNPYLYHADATIKANGFTRAGYSFSSWNTAADGSGTSYNPSDVYSVISDLTLYALWTAIPYTITYDGNGSTTGNTSDTGNPYIYNDVVTILPNSFIKDGYVFDSWNTNADGTGTEYAASDPHKLIDNMTLYAQWTAIDYGVIYVGNGATGGNTVDSNIYIYDDVANILANGYTRNGYTFSSWNTAADGSGVSYSSNDTYVVTGVLTLYAQWNAISYTIAYDGNKSTAGNTDDSNVYIYDDLATILTNGFIYPGYSFMEWNTAADGSGIRYLPSESLTIDGDLILYAIWDITEDDNYDINYRLYNGVNDSRNLTSYNVETDVTLYNPSKGGYTFGGWFAEEDSITRVDKIALGSVGDTTLHAAWYIHDINNVYAIEYILNGGTNDVANPETYTVESDTIVFNDATKAHYSFDGWYDDENLTVSKDTIKTGSYGAVTVYAKWSPVNYKISYETFGGKNPDNNPEMYTYESASITFSEPTKTGYTFAGWYSDENFNEKITKLDSKSSGDITLYAKWNIQVDIICKWGYVLLVSDSENQLEANFQWYKNGQKIDGATKVSLAGDNQTLCGEYTCEVKLKGSSEKFMLEPYSAHFNCSQQAINIYPSMVNKSSQITVEVFSEANNKFYTLDMYSMNGHKIMSKQVENESISSVDVPAAPGIYIVQLKNVDGLIKTQSITVK